MKRATQALLIAPDPDMRRAIINSQKQITIREGHRDYTPGPTTLYCAIEPWAVEVVITQVRHCRLFEVTEDEFVADGFKSLENLRTGMRRFYPNIELMSPVTVIHWAGVRGKYVDHPELHEAHLAGLPR